MHQFYVNFISSDISLVRLETISYTNAKQAELEEVRKQLVLKTLIDLRHI